jgi:hypothetical protein
MSQNLGRNYQHNDHAQQADQTIRSQSRSVAATAAETQLLVGVVPCVAVALVLLE